MRLQRLPVILCAITCACASVPPSSEMVEAVAPRTVEMRISGREALELRIPSGAVSILGEDTDTVRATLSIRCSPEARGCAKWAAKARLAAAHEGDRVRIELDAPARINAEVKIEVSAPRRTPLKVQMGYGELRARDFEDDISVAMKAGDVDIAMPGHAVGSVQLAARFGDASMRVGGRYIEGSRALVVGAKLDWHEGRGSHDVDVRLRYGDVQLELYQ